MSSVSINLIRNNSYCENSYTDDMVTIMFKNDTIHVKYTDRQSNETTKHALTLEKNGLAKYIKNIGYLFLTDTEPFTQIQFNFPGFPSYMLTREALKNTDTQDALMEIASMVNESWISEDDVLPPLIPLARHEYRSKYDDVQRNLPRHEYYDDEPYSGHY
jgi:hypothetical protein